MRMDVVVLGHSGQISEGTGSLPHVGRNQGSPLMMQMPQSQLRGPLITGIPMSIGGQQIFSSGINGQVLGGNGTVINGRGATHNPVSHASPMVGFSMNHRSLATDLHNLSVEFRKKQSTYLKLLRQQKEGQEDGIDLEMSMNGKSSFEADEFSDVGFNDYQMSKLKKSEEFSVEREREINQADRSQRTGAMARCATILVIMCLVMLVLQVYRRLVDINGQVKLLNIENQNCHKLLKVVDSALNRFMSGRQVL